jgi:hypothetical protein
MAAKSVAEGQHRPTKLFSMQRRRFFAKIVRRSADHEAAGLIATATLTSKVGQGNTGGI